METYLSKSYPYEVMEFRPSSSPQIETTSRSDRNLPTQDAPCKRVDTFFLKENKDQFSYCKLNNLSWKPRC